MRVDFDDWDGKEVTRVYIAGRLAEAALVEKALTERGVDYAVDLEPFRLMVLACFRQSTQASASMFCRSRRNTRRAPCSRPA
jgi:hypothetical protein